MAQWRSHWAQHQCNMYPSITSIVFWFQIRFKTTSDSLAVFRHYSACPSNMLLSRHVHSWNVCTICKNDFLTRQNLFTQFLPAVSSPAKAFGDICLPVMMGTRGIHNRHSQYKVVTYSQGSHKELLVILHLCTTLLVRHATPIICLRVED